MDYVQGDIIKVIRTQVPARKGAVCKVEKALTSVNSMGSTQDLLVRVIVSVNDKYPVGRLFGIGARRVDYYLLDSNKKAKQYLRRR
jgi:hypothetical protein